MVMGWHQNHHHLLRLNTLFSSTLGISSQLPTCKSIVSSNSGLRTLVLTSSTTVTSCVSVRFRPSIPLFLFVFGFFVELGTSRTKYLPCRVGVDLSI